MYPVMQTHIGIWFLTLHFALYPHNPGQGSMHFWFLHALSSGQSLLIWHSGRQFGGEPIMPGRQEQSHLSPRFLGGFEKGPQGLGSHGSSASTGAIAETCQHALSCITNYQLTYWFESTWSERVAYVPLNAGADRNMILHSANCIHTTGPGAGINAFVSLACFIRGAVRVDHTFRSTCYVWISKIFRDALTWSCSIASLTISIGSTRRWITRINMLSWNSWWCYNNMILDIDRGC